MSRALQLAKRGIYTTDPNPRVGCVIVKNNQIIGEGWHEYAGNAHAEINALNSAGKDVNDAIAYVTLEPCCHQGKTSACSEALINSGIKEVVIAMEDPNPLVNGKGITDLVRNDIVVKSGLLADQSLQLNPGFVKRLTTGLPYVRCKLAISMDGKIALSNGDSHWISSEHSRRDVQYLRARSSAILTSINTVMADNPSLNVRLDDLKCHQPLRVIIDTNLKISPTAKLIGLPGTTLVFTASDDKSKIEKLMKKGVEVETVSTVKGKINLKKVLSWLAKYKEVNEVLVESGSKLSGSLIKEKMVDELILYRANKLMGHLAKDMLQLPKITSMKDCPELKLIDQRIFGNDERRIFSIDYEN